MFEDCLTNTDADRTEAEFQLTERRRRVSHVRIYVALAMVVMVAYSVINPIFFTQDDEQRFAILLIPTFLLLGGYYGLTYWKRYVRYPLIDFVCLFAFALIIMVDNYLLASDLQRVVSPLHGSVTLNGMIVTAFAAVMLAGKTRWFIAWLALFMAIYASALVYLQLNLVSYIYAGLSHVSVMAVMLFINWALGNANRKSFRLSAALEVERAKTEELLYNVLPASVAERLKAGQIVADAYSDASVIFIDIVGFSQLSKRISPGHLIDVLNSFFSLADRCAAATGVEKVKTIGDAYLAISGGNLSSDNSADAALSFAEAVIAGLSEVQISTGVGLKVRIGVHSGPVVGGVIGETRMAYDYWGETMNIASRMEGAALPDGIAVSEASYMRVRNSRDFDAPQILTLKGVGEMPVYRLKADA